MILNSETKMEGIEFNFIELKKFHKKEEELESVLDKWLYFLKYAEDLGEVPKVLAGVEEIEKGFEVLTQEGWSERELRLYESIWGWKKRRRKMCYKQR